MSLRGNIRPVLLSGAATVLLTGCQHMLGQTTKDPERDKLGPATIQNATIGNNIVRAPLTTPVNAVEGAQTTRPTKPSMSILGQVPDISEDQNLGASGSNGRAPAIKARTVDAFVAPLPLPQFIDVVFGEMLKVPFLTGPDVASRADIVQLRSSGSMRGRDFLGLVSTALEEYGVRVVPENGAYQIVSDKALRAKTPRFITSRARSRTPSDLRPVIQFVELEAIDANTMQGFLFDAFGARQTEISIKSYPATNHIVLNGLPAKVEEAGAMIEQLDDLKYSGSQVRRYTPQYWQSAELGEALTRALQAEGWQVTSDPNLKRAIFLLPVEYSNDLFVFSQSVAAHERVSTWFREFDRPIDGGDAAQIFVYQVQNVDAVDLAETVNSVVQSAQSGFDGLSAGLTSPTTPGSATQAGGNDRAGSRRRSSSQAGLFTVDPSGNRLIFTGTANDYERYIKILRQLDTPAPEILIEVQIAEVTLTDNTAFGMEFFVDDIGDNRVQATAGTRNGLNLGGNGLSVAILSGNVDAQINAFADNRRVKLLSTPVLTARSGSTAEIQVGTDIPIITSQRAADNQSGGGNTDILQNIDYRETGVLLSIEPIVFSDNRVDLTITQEVSSETTSAGGSIASPTISNRTISTQLSLEDGATAVLGGLIQENYVRDDDGIPILKDIPVVGSAFSTKSFTIDRTELVVLITAYVLRGQADKNQFVQHLSGRIDRQFVDDSPLVTFLPRQK